MSAARDRVVRTALRAFAQDGYSGVSMRDLASDLGVKAPSLYSHFPSKAALFSECLTPLMTRIDSLLAQAPAVPATSAQIEAWLTDLIRALAVEPEAARILLTDPAMHQVASLTTRLDDETYRLLAMLEVFGIPDRLAAAATLGAMFYPVAQGMVTVENAPELARTVARLLRPAGTVSTVSPVSPVSPVSQTRPVDTADTAAAAIMSTGSVAAGG
jgi:AcrR family transcriptional regulator